MTGPSPAAVLPAPALPGLAGEAALGAAEPFADVPDRGNVRAGDDGDRPAQPVRRASPTRTRPWKRTPGRPAPTEHLTTGAPKTRHPKTLGPEAQYAKARCQHPTASRRIPRDQRRPGRAGRGGWRQVEAERRRVIGGKLLGDLARRRLPVRVRTLRPAAARGPYGVRGQRGHAVGDGGVGGRAASVLRGGGRAAVGHGVHPPLAEASLAEALGPVPGRRHAVGRKTGAGRAVGYSIVRRCGLGGSGLGCGRLLRRPPGRHRDAVWLRVLLVADQVITGSP